MPRTRSIFPVHMVCGCDACKELTPRARELITFTSYQVKHMALHGARKAGWRKLWGVWYYPGHFVPKSRTKKPRKPCPECGKQLTVNLDGTLRLHWHALGAERVRVKVQA